MEVCLRRWHEYTGKKTKHYDRLMVFYKDTWQLNWTLNQRANVPWRNQAWDKSKTSTESLL